MAASHPEIHVLGAGPTGALTALALGLEGQRVVLFDPLTAAELQERSRAYAITHSSRRLLTCLLYTSPSPRDVEEARMPSSA